MRRSDGYTLVEMLIVVSVIGILSAIAMPMIGNAVRGYRLSGDARTLSNTLALAKMRSAATFTRTRLYVDLNARTYAVERWSGGAWVADGGVNALSSGIVAGFNNLGAAPPNTQAVISQAPPCVDADGADIAGTACVTFNSRGIPIDNAGAPSGIDALYVTDGTAVAGITVAATGLIRSWQSRATAVQWTRQ